MAYQLLVPLPPPNSITPGFFEVPKPRFFFSTAAVQTEPSADEDVAMSAMEMVLPTITQDPESMKFETVQELSALKVMVPLAAPLMNRL